MAMSLTHRHFVKPARRLSVFDGPTRQRLVQLE
jgi:hypothetical protein